LETKSTTKKQRKLENGKVRFRLNIDVRKEKEDSWLNAIKTKIAFVKGRLNFRSKSTTAANVHLMESLLDTWPKNNHITVDKICYLRSLLVPGFFFTSFSFQTYFSTALILEGAKTLWHQKNKTQHFLSEQLEFIR